MGRWAYAAFLYGNGTNCKISSLSCTRLSNCFSRRLVINKLREIVFESIDEFKRQELEYQAKIVERVSMVDPSLMSWIPNLLLSAPVQRSTTTLMAEDILAELERSEWIQIDDRAVILTKLIAASQQVAHSAMGVLMRELQVLDSPTFIMEKKTRVRRLQEFICRLRARMQQWIDISIPAFSGMPFTMGGAMDGGAMGTMGTMGAMGAGASALVGNPLIDIFEEDVNVIVRASLPGVDMDKTFIGVVNGGTCLQISGEVELENKSFFRKEIPAGKFKRVIQLPYQCEEDNAEASMEQGLLTIKLVKKGSTKIDIA